MRGLLMGMYNRDWYKANAGGRWSDWGVYDLTPAVKYIIIANVLVFIAQAVITREVPLSTVDLVRRQSPHFDKLIKENGDDPETIERLKKEHPRFKQAMDATEEWAEERGERISIPQEWGQLETAKVLHGQVWRLVTHAFCHERMSIFHIAFNMLFLYWFGCTIEAMYGTREFVLFYLVAAIFAGLTYMGLELATGSRIPAIGASGAVMAVTMLYAMHFPRETIHVFWLIRIEMRFLMLFYVIYDLHPVLLQLGGNNFFTGVGHAAHLGGLLFGFLYGFYEWRFAPLLAWLPESRRSLRPRPRLRVVRERDPQPLEPPAPDPEMEQIDDILRKIAETGQASLNDDERALLQRASERMKSRRRS